VVHAADTASFERAAAALRDAFLVGDGAVAGAPVVIEALGR
jgi:hypothetical protein